MWELMLLFFLQLGLGMSLALKWDELFWLGWFEFFCSADQIDIKWLLLIACRPFQISPALRSTLITMSNSSDFCWVAQEQWEGRIWLSILKVRSACGFSFHWGFVFILLINLVRHSCRLNHMWLLQASTQVILSRLPEILEWIQCDWINNTRSHQIRSHQHGGFILEAANHSTYISMRFIHAAFKYGPVWASNENFELPYCSFHHVYTTWY